MHIQHIEEQFFFLYLNIHLNIIIITSGEIKEKNWVASARLIGFFYTTQQGLSIYIIGKKGPAACARSTFPAITLADKKKDNRKNPLYWKKNNKIKTTIGNEEKETGLYFC